MDDMKLPVYNCDFSVVTRQHLGWAWTKLHQICSIETIIDVVSSPDKIFGLWLC